jgi:hypothetical protein
VATAEENRLNIRRNLHTSFAGSDCQTIAIYEYGRKRIDELLLELVLHKLTA